MSTSHWKPKLLSQRATSDVGRSLWTLTLHWDRVCREAASGEASVSSTDLLEKRTSISRLARNLLEELIGGSRRSSSLQLRHRWRSGATAVRASRSVGPVFSMAQGASLLLAWCCDCDPRATGDAREMPVTGARSERRSRRGDAVPWYEWKRRSHARARAPPPLGTPSFRLVPQTCCASSAPSSSPSLSLQVRAPNHRGVVRGKPRGQKLSAPLIPTYTRTPQLCVQ